MIENRIFLYENEKINQESLAEKNLDHRRWQKRLIRTWEYFGPMQTAMDRGNKINEWTYLFLLPSFRNTRTNQKQRQLSEMLMVLALSKN